MNDASEQYAQLIEVARLAADRGDRLAAVQALNAAIETTRTSPGLHREHAAALVRLGVLQQELGRLLEAERLIKEAIVIGERHFGVEHPSLSVALNELGRLYIRQSAFARAEPVLRRLLQITRAKGDRHPDVATVIAGLAVTKRGLGDHAGAEGLYRYALRIREQALAPNHMAIVITLEQLAETCAARGNNAEAMVHLERALMRREAALGAEHATVRALRARMSDLEIRHAEATARAALTPAVPTPVIEATPTPTALEAVIDATPVPSQPSVVVEPPAPSAPPPRASGERRATPLRSRSVVPVAPRTSGPKELTFLYQPEAATSHPAPAARISAPVHAASVPTTSDTRTEDAVQPMVSVSPDFTVQSAAASSAGWTPASPNRRTKRYATVAGALVVLASAGLGFRSHSVRPSEPVADETTQVPTTLIASTSSARSQTTLGASAGVADERTEPSRIAAASGSHPANAAAAATPSADSPAAPAAGTAIALPRLAKLTVPKIAMPNVDSVVRSSARLGRDDDSEAFGSAGVLRAPTPGEELGITPPVLIGSAPTPRYPDELRTQRLEGDVVVEFRVNEKGRVDASSMQVVQSQHPLFTEAVRNTLPRFRFEPARASSRDAKPQAAWVQFRTRFTARN